MDKVIDSEIVFFPSSWTFPYTSSLWIDIKNNQLLPSFELFTSMKT